MSEKKGMVHIKDPNRQLPPLEEVSKFYELKDFSEFKETKVKPLPKEKFKITPGIIMILVFTAVNIWQCSEINTVLNWVVALVTFGGLEVFGICIVCLLDYFSGGDVFDVKYK